MFKFYANNNQTKFANEAVKASITFDYVYDESQLEYSGFKNDGRLVFDKDTNYNKVEVGNHRSLSTTTKPWGTDDLYLGALVFNILGESKDIVFTVNNIRLRPTISEGSDTLPYTYVIADTSVVVNPDKIEQHDIVVEHDPMADVIYTGAADNKATADAALQEYIGETWEDLKSTEPEQPTNPDIGQGEVDPWGDEDLPGFGESNEEISLAIVENSVVTAVEEAVLAEGTGDVIVAEELPTVIETVEETEAVQAEDTGTEITSDSELIVPADNTETTPSVTAVADSSSSSTESAPTTVVEPAESNSSNIPEAPAAPASYEAA